MFHHQGRCKETKFYSCFPCAQDLTSIINPMRSVFFPIVQMRKVRHIRGQESLPSQVSSINGTGVKMKIWALRCIFFPQLTPSPMAVGSTKAEIFVHLFIALLPEPRTELSYCTRTTSIFRWGMEFIIALPISGRMSKRPSQHTSSKNWGSYAHHLCLSKGQTWKQELLCLWAYPILVYQAGVRQCFYTFSDENIYFLHPMKCPKLF